MPFRRRIPLTTKGDLLAHDGTRLVRLPAGEDGQAIVADAAEDAGLKWGEGGGGGSLASISGQTNLAAGGDLELVCSAIGTSLAYQWKRGVTNVGTNSNTLAIAGVTGGDAGSYRCEVTSAEGVAMSNALAVTVTALPQIDTETPPTQTPDVNESIDFVVTASGGGTLAYQWQKLNPGNSQWENVTGQVAATMTRTASEATQGSYRCRVSNAVGEAVSSVMFFSVAPPVITTQPTALDPTASVVATGAGTLAYQWYYGNTPIAGATDSTIDLGDHVDDLDLSLNLPFKVKVSNGAGFVFSNEVGAIVAKQQSDGHGGYQNANGQAVTVNGSPTTGYTAWASLMPLSVFRTSEVTFFANLSRKPGTTYAWTRSGVSVGSGDTDVFGTPIPNLTLRNVQAGDAGVYVCTATNAQGSVASDPFEIGTVIIDDNGWEPPISLPFDVKVFTDETISKSLSAKRPEWDLTTGTQGHGYRGHVGVAIYSLDASDYVGGSQQGSAQFVSGFIPENGLVVSSSAVTKSVTLDGATLPTHANIRLNDVRQGWNPNADPPETPKEPWAHTPGGAGWGTPLATFDCTVIARAAITAQPVGGVAVLGGAFTLGVTATGGNLEYGWWKDGVRVFAEAGAEWVRATLAANDGGDYQVKVGNRSTETLHVVESDEVNLNVIGITATPASGNFSAADTVPAQYCGTPGTVEFALVVDGVVGTYQDSNELEIGDNFGVPLKLRIRHKTQTDKWHESGEFTATQIIKWRVYACGVRLDNGQPAATNGHVTLGQLFPNGGTVDLNNGNPNDVDFTLPVATAIGQFTNHTVYASYGTLCVMPHDITFESV